MSTHLIKEYSLKQVGNKRYVLVQCECGVEEEIQVKYSWRREMENWMIHHIRSVSTEHEMPSKPKKRNKKRHENLDAVEAEESENPVIAEDEPQLKEPE